MPMPATPTAAPLLKSRRLNIAHTLAEARVLLKAEIKEREAKVEQIDLKLFPMVEDAGDMLDLGDLKPVIVRQFQETTNVDAFVKALEHAGVKPVIIAKARKAATERKPKKPFIQIRTQKEA
jgi:hypothetical protein